MQKFLPLLILTLLTGGCSAIPSSGPTAGDVTKEADLPQIYQRYELVDIVPGVPDVLRQRRPDNTLTNFGDYRPSVEPHIGIGDTVSVTIWEASAGGLFSAPVVSDRFTTGSKSATIPDQVVGRDGSISVPYAGRVRVAGKTTQAVQLVVEEALQGKAIQPQVLINDTKATSNTVTVLGEVTAGARVPLSVKGDRVLDVIATAGGVRAPINESFVQLMRGSRTARVAMSRMTTDPRENIFVRPNDVLTVIRDPQKFIAYGATGTNAEIPFDAEGINLAQALAKAGGLQDYRSDATGVFLFRYEPDYIARAFQPDKAFVPGQLAPVVYRLDLKDPNSMFLAQQFRVFNHDLIYVSNAPLTEVSKVVQIFDMALAPASGAASVYAGVK
jgi:polysaccharide export outer membrane protein